MKTCPSCKQTLTDTAKFCFFCGASLLDVAPETPAPVTDDIAPVPSEEPVEPVAATEPEPEPYAEPEPAPYAEPEPEPIRLPEADPAPEPEPIIPSKPEPAVPVTPVFVPEPTPVPEPAPAPAPVVAATDSRSLMTTVGYIFTWLLFHIPVIGLIFMIVWGCGKTKNISRKRFSLAFLIMRLICWIVVLAAAVFLLVCFSGVINGLWDAIRPILFA